MEEQPTVTKEGFSAVQGCLIAAVVLFVLLLGVSIVLGYRQFREHTGDPAPAALLAEPRLPTASSAGAADILIVAGRPGSPTMLLDL